MILVIVVAGLLALLSLTIAGVASQYSVFVHPETGTGILAGGYVAGGIILLVAAIPLGLATVGSASDLPILLTTPLSPRAIFAQKLLVAALWEAALTLAFLAPLTIGMGIAWRAGAWYYLAAVLLLVATPLLPLSLGYMAVFALLRVVSARTVRTVLGIFGALLGMSWYLTRLLPGRGLADKIEESLATVGGDSSWWLPSSWPGHALARIAFGDFTGALTPGLTYLLLAVCAFAGSVGLAATIAKRGWFDVAGPIGKRGRRSRGASFSGLEKHEKVHLEGPIRAIAIKDWRTIRRDPLVWTRLLAPLAAFGIVVYHVLQSAASTEGPFAGSLRATAVLIAVSFLAWSLNNRLALSAFNRERGAVVWLLASPVSAGKVMFGKLITALVPQLAILVPASLLLVIIEGAHGVEAVGVLTGTPLLVVSLSAVTMIVATRFPKFDWQDIRRVNTWPAIVISSLLQLAATAAVIVLVVGPSVLAALTGTPGDLSVALEVVGLAIATLLSVALASYLLINGSRRVAAWEYGG